MPRLLSYSLVGTRFGRLLVQAAIPGIPITWDCLCDCGQRCRSLTHNLTQGRMVSCGCLRREKSRERMRQRHATRIPHDPSETRRRQRQRAQKYRLAHPARVRQSKQRARQKDHAKRKLARARYYAQHKEREHAMHQIWRNNNPDNDRMHQARRKARKLAAPRNDLTVKQWQTIKAAYNSCCAYCGKPSKRLSQDHILPLSKGGAHTLQNVVPACKSCNSKKYTGPPLRAVQPLLL